MISGLLELEGLGCELAERARAADALLIWRAQERLVRRLVVRQGRSESSSTVVLSGHAVQVLAANGYAAQASSDDLRPRTALTLLEQALAAASAGAGLGLERVSRPELEAVRGRALSGDPSAFDGVDLAAAGRRLAELEAEIQGRVPAVTCRLSYVADLDAWRVFRSDGTDVLFSMPRCTLVCRATGAGRGARHGVSATAFDPRPDMLWDEEVVTRFLTRAEKAAGLARDLPDAPTHPAGSFPIVIDYALAKGLAHEAFGHAAEADGFRSSILGREGRFRAGDRVGAERVSIIDEPIEGDHAWQPFSVNGVPRSRVALVEHGRLAEGISDIWSAAPGGVRLTGAARAESFHDGPLPRMSNIRIEVSEPLPAAGAFEDYGPEGVRDLLRAAGLFGRHPRWAFLSGYAGGQANSSTGDFAFHCKSIYLLGPQGATLHKPAIFSGSMFGALESVREAFGPLRLDAIGYCGKWGQSVPSSGGSHYFLALDPHPSVRLGGR